MSLEERLSKIRDQPKLQNQQQTAVVLSAIEDTLRSQNSDFTPTAYFAALLSLLGHQITEKSIASKETATAVIYLLDLVTPHAPAPLLRSKFTEILTSLAPALVHPEAEAPLLRSSIGCLESLLIIQDARAWELPQTQISPRRAVAGLLNIAVDPRPKVRKRAQDALAKVLGNPPPSPSLDHPAADMCAETALKMLKDVADAAGKIKKHKGHKDQGNDPGMIHALHLIKTVATASGGWPSRKIDVLCELLLNISKSSNEYLTMAAFEIFEVIFAGMADEISSAKLPRLLEVISELQPSKNDSQLLPPWIAVISRGYEVSAQIEPEDTFAKLPELFNMISTFLTSPSHNIRVSSSECLISFLVNLIPDSVILEPSIYDEKILEKVAKIAVDLLSVKFQAAWMEVFSMLCAMFETLRWRSDPILRPVVKIVGELRTNESFSGKKEADAVISRAIGAMGPDVVLDILPLNLPRPQPGQAGRVWMLPLLRDSVHNTKLAHFRSEMVPLSEQLFQKVIDHGNKEKTIDIKVFETVVQQIWSILPGYCDLPLDLTEAFDQTFAEMLANLLYGQAELRTDVCRALQNLVDSNKAIVDLELEGEEELVAQSRTSKADAKKNLEHLSTFAGNMLAVLFNVYSETLPQYRGTILRTINAYLSIISEKELMETFERVATSLEQSLAESGSQTQADKQKQDKTQNKMPPMSHTLMDLVITISLYLPRDSYPSLFRMAATMINKDDDPQLQKKAYKLIPRLAESQMGKAALEERSGELQQLIVGSADKASAPARRDRLVAISQIIEFLPQTDLHFIPSILSEVVISAKEVNEKAREAAYDLLVAMGEKMGQGGTVVQSKVPSMPDDAPSVEASLEEYFTMVSAGLAATTPHMISASITAVTRILFEFHTRISNDTIQNLLEVMDIFLQNPNREIVRSVLGFVKVEVVSLPEALVKPRLNAILSNLLVWSHEHKAHFKAKVKHIVERMVRKFGVEAVERACPPEDRKLITNIRKTREARKKKRDLAKEDGDEIKEKPKGKFESEYDQAVYGSESEDSDEGDSESEFVKSQSKQRANGAGKHGPQTYIVEDEDEPLDLLSKSAMGNISSTKPLRQRQVPKKMTKAKTDEDGKLILGDSDEEAGFSLKSKKGGKKREDDGDVLMDIDEDGATLEQGINAYVDAIRGKDAAQRGQKGKLKFSNKRQTDDEMDVDSDDERPSRKQKSGSGMGRGGGGFKTQRKGLGVQKVKGGNIGGSGGGGRVSKSKSPKMKSRNFRDWKGPQ